MLRKSQLTAVALAVAMLAGVGAANAGSSYQTGAGALSASASVDFQIVIPKILSLRVGTGALMTNNGAVDLVTFTVPAANVGDSSVIAGTGGDLGSGVVTAAVKGNNGNVTLSATTLGAINNGGTDTIEWSQIDTAAAALTTGTTLAAPTLSSGATTNVALTAVGKVVNQDARWTYTYKNQNIVPAGTYGGVNANNGRVTYTAALP